ncbi:MAG: sulfite exporter TauE/SafE family protein [Proteobacteria bacterium]|nr:sulfite exporter TauE/SafE family protein [Pseudomonadota bacterium]MCP4918402.1 sulfite exporter TauE/SafE family protein [Pseudomonadota bacterium]
MWAVVGTALLAGLVGSPHCLGMCGGFAAAAPGPQWHLGRLATYTGLGAVAASVGWVLPGPPWIPHAVAAALLLLMAAQLAGLKLPGSGSRLFLAIGKLAPRSPLVLGLATGLLPCGLVYAALSMALSTSDPMWGAATMAAFWLGTVPALAAAMVAFKKLATRLPGGRIGLAALVLVLGLGTVAWRLPAALATSAADGPGEECH